jgi:Holliday junction resolvase-like predicted endonuclease
MKFHTKAINDIFHRLKESKKYDSIGRNILYSISEMDVVALKKVCDKNYMLVFEVKSSYHCRRKAMTQLEKHKVTFEDKVDRLFKFYVTPKEHTSKKQYTLEWIKDDTPILSKSTISKIRSNKTRELDYKVLDYLNNKKKKYNG